MLRAVTFLLAVAYTTAPLCAQSLESCRKALGSANDPGSVDGNALSGLPQDNWACNALLQAQYPKAWRKLQSMKVVIPDAFTNDRDAFPWAHKKYLAFAIVAEIGCDEKRSFRRRGQTLVDATGEVDNPDVPSFAYGEHFLSAPWPSTCLEVFKQMRPALHDAFFPPYQQQDRTPRAWRSCDVFMNDDDGNAPRPRREDYSREGRRRVTYYENATAKQREACMKEMKSHYPDAWSNLNWWQQKTGFVSNRDIRLAVFDSTFNPDHRERDISNCAKFMEASAEQETAAVKKVAALCVAELKNRQTIWHPTFDEPPFFKAIERRLSLDRAEIPAVGALREALLNTSFDTKWTVATALEIDALGKRRTYPYFHKRRQPSQWPSLNWLRLNWLRLPGQYGTLASLLFGLWLAITALRLALVIPARWLGLYNPNHFWLWSLLWPWRPLYNLVGKRFARKRREWFEHGKGASARWASWLESMALLYKPGGAFLGRLTVMGFGLFQPVGWSLERHVVLLGATAAGKTRWLITLLGLARGNVLVVDVAAQMVNVIGRRLGGGGRGIMGMGRDVHTFDPYGLAHGRKTSRWNVFREMDRFIREHGPQTEVWFSQKLAESLIRPEKNPENAWVTSEAQGFVAGLVLYMRRKYEREPEKLNLIQMRRLIATGLEAPNARKGERVDGFRLLLDDMKAMGGTIATAAGTMEASLRSGGGSPPHGACLDLMKWLDLDEMQAIVGGDSDFDLHDLKVGKVSLFICAPVDDVRGTLSGFFRLVTLLTMSIFRRLETTKAHLKNPLLLVMDEMPALGNIEGMEDVAPEMRKHGMKLVCVAQELEGLEKAYPSSWRTFLSNSDARVFMSLGDPDTIDYLGDALGSRKRRSFLRFKVKEENKLLDRQQIEDFLHPDAANVIVIRYGRPLKLKNAIYYKELPVYAYDADPRYQEPLGRRWGRKICQRLIAGPEFALSSGLSLSEPGSTPTHTFSAPAAERPQYQEPPTPTASPREETGFVEETPKTSAEDADNLSANENGDRRSGQRSSKRKAVDPLFLRLFEECFEEAEGDYPHPVSRREAWEEFAIDLTQGGDFNTLKFRFEEWAADYYKEKGDRARGENIIMFFDKKVRAAKKGGNGPDSNRS